MSTRLPSVSQPKITTEPPWSLSDVSFEPLAPPRRSPCDWRDHVLYFLLPDRFADGEEDQRPLYSRDNPDQFNTLNRTLWMDSGRRWQGGRIKGIIGKLDYLQRLGVTAIWVGPVWRQRKEDPFSYHGYGIQNFLDVDPRFGTRQDLRDLVDAAHARKMVVILDIIFNHTGNNWFYKGDDGKPWAGHKYEKDKRLEFHGWRTVDGVSLAETKDLGPDDGVWPQELQNPNLYHRRGAISAGLMTEEAGRDVMDPAQPFRYGDFPGDLKDLDHEHSPALAYMIDVYKYWIALSDCDGFRIDTVKHMSDEASRKFCRCIREFAESIGKQHFLLVGEVTGDDKMRIEYLDIFGQNLSAVLDIHKAPLRLASLARGDQPAADAFFGQFVSSAEEPLGGYRDTGRYHVSVLDDHDMVWLARTNGDDEIREAVGIQLTTPGIPCIYYGTEQAFDGSYKNGATLPPKEGYLDRFIRESMFGSDFGAFGTTGCQFFDESHPTYRRIAAIARVRGQASAAGLALRRGRLCRRETFLPEEHVALPTGPGKLVAWSRIMDTHQVLVVLNTYAEHVREAEVMVDPKVHPEGSCLTYLYRSDWNDDELGNPPTDRTAAVTCRQDGKAVIHIDLPPAGMAILA